MLVFTGHLVLDRMSKVTMQKPVFYSLRVQHCSGLDIIAHNYVMYCYDCSHK